jgi:hypothetical protein
LSASKRFVNHALRALDSASTAYFEPKSSDVVRFFPPARENLPVGVLAAKTKLSSDRLS